MTGPGQYLPLQLQELPAGSAASRPLPLAGPPFGHFLIDIMTLHLRDRPVPRDHGCPTTFSSSNHALHGTVEMSKAVRGWKKQA